MKYNINKKTIVFLGLTLVAICFLSIFFIYYGQFNEAGVVQEIIAEDFDMVIDDNDQQNTLLGEISQQKLSVETDSNIGTNLEIEILNIDSIDEIHQEQQSIAISSYAATESLVLDEKVLARKSTGADLESSKLTLEEELQWEQVWGLRFITPVKNDFFEIYFNSKNRLFEVILRDEVARDELQSWLTKNDFSQIPPAFFLYSIAY